MKYIEVRGDLFSDNEAEVLVHCISADAKMGAGIAKMFRGDYPLMGRYIRLQQPKVGGVVLYKDIQTDQLIGNLVTKEKFFHKPTYGTLEESLYNLKNDLLELGITRIAMPRIGAGLDRLNWNKNRDIIQRVFKNTEIEITVYYLD